MFVHLTDGDTTKPNFLSQVSCMDTSKMRKLVRHVYSYWGDMSREVDNISETWNSITWSISMDFVLQQIVDDSTLQPCLFDAMWYQVDLLMWNAATTLDKPSEPGQVAKEFSLVNLHDLNCPP
jgi:hypothetical protein